MAITPDSFLRSQRLMALLMVCSALLAILLIAGAYFWGHGPTPGG